MATYIRAGEDLSFLDQAGFWPTQKRVSAQTIEDYRSSVRSGQPFWEEPDYALDPIEVSNSGAIKDGHHRLAAVLLEGLLPVTLPPGTIRTVAEDQILFPPRSWGNVIVDP